MASIEDVVRQFLFDPVNDETRRKIWERLRWYGFPVEKVLFVDGRDVRVDLMDGETVTVKNVAVGSRDACPGPAKPECSENGGA